MGRPFGWEDGGECPICGEGGDDEDEDALIADIYRYNEALDADSTRTR